ncbi:hypothetical protein HMPREF0970_00531 [Schaalia odontolytica F0309]|uniref:Uncharacterized protein n=1 Tax=Schaalia odontolytica F0309 TaxID=649742 RepID=D4TX74_9ACTO|nr:hypothetical protein HMPREF0970_00531 [Schaalia odontolytica F0309]
MLYDSVVEHGNIVEVSRHNAAFGARCFLTRPQSTRSRSSTGLNAPFGARCFMTCRSRSTRASSSGS